MLKFAVRCSSLLLFTAAVQGQAVYTASRVASVQVGVAASSYTLDYGKGREGGLTIYGDMDISRHLGVEALFRDASIETPHDIGENHALIGPRLRVNYGRATPYAKLLIGVGTVNFQKGYNRVAYSDTYLTYGMGAGLDLHAMRRVNLRLFDIEYLTFPGFPPHGLTPWGASIGAAYTF